MNIPPHDVTTIDSWWIWRKYGYGSDIYSGLARTGWVFRTIKVAFNVLMRYQFSPYMDIYGLNL